MRFLLHSLSLFFRLLPRRCALAVGALLGWIWYTLVPVRRAVAMDNLRRALPDSDRRRLRVITRGCFFNLAVSAIEFLRLPSLNRERVDRLIEHTGWEHYLEAVQLGKGVIVVTAHFGNFDLLACAEAIRGMPLHVISRDQHNRGINDFWMSVRTRHGLQFIPVKESIFRIHRLLKEGQVVAFVIDQHMPEGRGIRVPFFGRPASTTHAPALMALSTGAPILPATIERLPGGRHRVTLEPLVFPNPGNQREEEIVRLTMQLNDWLEGKVRARPDHWLWIHRRWKLDP